MPNNESDATLQTDLVPEGAPPAHSLGRATGSGFSWLTLCLIAGKLLSFATQLVLGWYLFKEDFGLLAIATSIANFVKVFNDGGVAQVLIQRGGTNFERLSTPAFWIGMVFSLISAGLLALCAPWAAAIYDDARLVPMLLILALTMVLSAPATIFKAKLRLDMQFKTLSWQGTAWFFLRYVGTILLAYWGFGAMSFVLPLPVVSIFECLVTYQATRIAPWRGNAQFSIWSHILGSSTWVLIASFARAIARNGDYLVLGLLVSQGVVGQYFFGYQLTAQFAILMASNIQFVLFPVLTRFANQPDRQASAMVRTIRMIMLVSGPISLMVALNIESLETLLWHNKWAMVVPLMQVFSLFAPVRLIPDVLHAAITSRGEFRRSAQFLLMEGLVLMFSAWLAVVLCGTNLTGIAWVVGFSQTGFSLALTVFILNRHGISLGSIVAAILPSWACSVVATGVAWWIGSSCLPSEMLMSHVVFDTVVFSAVFLGLMRVFFASHLGELAGVLPNSLAGVIRRTLCLGVSLQST